MPLVLGGSGVSGGKELGKLLVTMTMARLDPQMQKYTSRAEVNLTMAKIDALGAWG